MLKLLQEDELPLLGSNQDSSDPESDAVPSFDAFMASEDDRIGKLAARSAPVAPTKLPPTSLTDEEQRERKRESLRRVRLKSSHGLSVQEFDAMLAEQNGVCAICHKSCKSGRRLSVDHCHQTNQNRGLLCKACNIGLGSFRDDVNALERAVAYLRQHEPPPRTSLRPQDAPIWAAGDRRPPRPRSQSLLERQRLHTRTFAEVPASTDDGAMLLEQQHSSVEVSP